MRSHEVAEPGWSRKMVQEYSRADIKAPKWLIKEWDYYLIQNKDFAVAARDLLPSTSNRKSMELQASLLPCFFVILLFSLS